MAHFLAMECRLVARKRTSAAFQCGSALGEQRKSGE